MTQSTVKDICQNLENLRTRGHRGALLYNLNRGTAVGHTYAPRALAAGDVLIELYVAGRPTGEAEVRTLLQFESVTSGHAVGVPLVAYERTEEVPLDLGPPGPCMPSDDGVDGRK